jgi:adenylosuccinate lyase
MHEILRQHALVAWHAVQQGKPNPLIERFQQDTQLLSWITCDEIRPLADLDSYTGLARNQAMDLVRKIREEIK